MKAFARKLVLKILNNQVQRLLKKNEVYVIAVVGSVGKTTTKMAIAEALGTKQELRYQSGNYNDPVTVPLVFFDLPLPSLFNPLAWLSVFVRAELQIRRRYNYKFVILEFGIDGPGQMKQFADCVSPDLAVVTALTPEHMEYFDSLAEVAKEELAVAEFSKNLLINADMSPEEFLSELDSGYKTYGFSEASSYRIKNVNFGSHGADFELLAGGVTVEVSGFKALSNFQLYAPVAAIAVALMNSFSEEEAGNAVAKFKPVNGRLNVLKGIKNSTIIDDTYNASPEATKAAIQILTNFDVEMSGAKKIALLGNMNELGVFSEEAHKEVGGLCRPNQIDHLITLGPDANEFLAAAAEANGCEVFRARSPYEAGEVIKGLITPGSVVLFKGSQNNVFSEEAIKCVLADEKDHKLLVRQSKAWLKKKETNFK
jgi:UDP-N-acetylmuramoyl-tripeptide--D-alanyl-D-alanine ligase